MKNNNYTITMILFLLFAVGCGGNVSVTGKVTLSDGNPMNIGRILFETDAVTLWGDLQQDGTYTMYSSDQKGVPRGTYRVSFTGGDPTIIQQPDGTVRSVSAAVPFDQKYFSGETSGLTCEVKGKTTFNITLDPPK